MQKSLLLLRDLLFAFSLSLLALPAAAQIVFEDVDAADVKPLALSISGGISLGSYQAGVNFGLLEVYRHAAWNPEFRDSTRIPRYRLRSVTGASAGNINTLLWAIEACTDLRNGSAPYRSPDPESSLFWQVWLEIGWARLFRANSEERALFDRAALIDSVAKPILERRVNDPRLSSGCEVPAGITLTRVQPDTIHLQDLPIETQRHVTTFTMEVLPHMREVGQRLRFRQVEEIKPEDQYFGSVIRLEPHDGDIPLDTLLKAVKASAAFPVAFAPVELKVWYPAKGSVTQMFMDGGAFDNNPVGLARNLYGLSEDSARLDILYVNPRRFRGTLREARRTGNVPAPSGGFASVARFVAGAVPTARQYELQLLARERRQRIREEELLDRVSVLRTMLRAEEVHSALPADDRPSIASERLLLTSRAYPVFGEHLGSFAAFLARPAREFDFYVGMYDAFYMALEKYRCAGEPDVPACVGPRLRELIQSPALLRDTARHVLAGLYNHEFSSEPIPLPVPPSAASDRLVVQSALLQAMGTRFRPVVPDSTCFDSRLVHTILCGDGLLEVLNTIREDRDAVRVLRHWARECTPEECNVEREFVSLVTNPMWQSTVMLEDVMQRLAYVEDLMRNDPSERKDYLGSVTASNWLYHASHLRSRPFREWTPGAVPSHSALRYVPFSYLGVNLGAGGVEGRWQPTLNLRSPWYVRAPVIVHYNGDPIDSSEKLYVGAGAGFGRYVSKVWLSEVGVGWHHLRPWVRAGNSGAAVNEWEVHAVVVANQLRIGLRLLDSGDDLGRLHGRYGWSMSAGFNDPLGLIYWIAQLPQ